MALLEALRKLCSSLYLGCPGGTEAFGKSCQEGTEPPPTPTPQLLESRVSAPLEHSGASSFLLESGRASAKLAALAELVFCDFISLPFGERILHLGVKKNISGQLQG